MKPPRIREKVRALIARAELICYPMGSFYSSLVANLLPQGVTPAIRANGAPKIFTPNTGRDLEMVEGGVAFQVAELLRYLQGSEDRVPVGELVNYVLVDSKRGIYPGGLDKAAVEALGVKVVDAPLASEEEPERLDPEALAGVLLSLV